MKNFSLITFVGVAAQNHRGTTDVSKKTWEEI